MIQQSAHSLSSYATYITIPYRPCSVSDVNATTDLRCRSYELPARVALCASFRRIRWTTYGTVSWSFLPHLVLRPSSRLLCQYEVLAPKRFTKFDHVRHLKMRLRPVSVSLGRRGRRFGGGNVRSATAGTRAVGRWYPVMITAGIQIGNRMRTGFTAVGGIGGDVD